jgi:hypothetical protein
MSLEEATKIFDSVSETDDVGQKRYLMFQCFEELLSELEKDSFKNLNGYLYKVSQDFLTSSSTYEKTQKMEKLLNHVEKKQG